MDCQDSWWTISVANLVIVVSAVFILLCGHWTDTHIDTQMHTHTHRQTQINALLLRLSSACSFCNHPTSSSSRQSLVSFRAWQTAQRGWFAELCGVRSTTTLALSSPPSRSRHHLVVVIDWRLSGAGGERAMWQWHALCDVLTTLGWLGSMSDIPWLCVWSWASSTSLRMCPRWRRSRRQPKILRRQRLLSSFLTFWLQYTYWTIGNTNTTIENVGKTIQSW